MSDSFKSYRSWMKLSAQFSADYCDKL